MAQNTEVGRPLGGTFRFRTARQPVSEQFYPSPIRFVEAAETCEQRGLSASRRPHHRNGLSRIERETDPTQGKGLLFGCVVKAIQVEGFQHVPHAVHRKLWAIRCH